MGTTSAADALSRKRLDASSWETACNAGALVAARRLLVRPAHTIVTATPRGATMALQACHIIRLLRFRDTGGAGGPVAHRGRRPRTATPLEAVNVELASGTIRLL